MVSALMSRPQPVRELSPFRDPTSVAVAEAWDTLGTWGNGVAEAALRGTARRSAYLIGTARRAGLGRHTYRSRGDLPEVPEPVVLTVPMPAFGTTVVALDARDMSDSSVLAGGLVD